VLGIKILCWASRGAEVSFLRKQESRKKLDSHFRGNDIQGKNWIPTFVGMTYKGAAWPGVGCHSRESGSPENSFKLPLAQEEHTVAGTKQPGFLLTQE